MHRGDNTFCKLDTNRERTRYYNVNVGISSSGELIIVDVCTFLGNPGGPPKSTVMSVRVFSMMSFRMALPLSPVSSPI